MQMAKGENTDHDKFENLHLTKLIRVDNFSSMEICEGKGVGVGCEGLPLPQRLNLLIAETV